MFGSFSRQLLAFVIFSIVVNFARNKVNDCAALTLDQIGVLRNGDLVAHIDNLLVVFVAHHLFGFNFWHLYIALCTPGAFKLDLVASLLLLVDCDHYLFGVVLEARDVELMVAFCGQKHVNFAFSFLSISDDASAVVASVDLQVSWHFLFNSTGVDLHHVNSGKDLFLFFFGLSPVLKSLLGRRFRLHLVLLAVYNLVALGDVSRTDRATRSWHNSNLRSVLLDWQMVFEVINERSHQSVKIHQALNSQLRVSERSRARRILHRRAHGVELKADEGADQVAILIHHQVALVDVLVQQVRLESLSALASERSKLRCCLVWLRRIVQR